MSIGLFPWSTHSRSQAVVIQVGCRPATPERDLTGTHVLQESDATFPYCPPLPITKHHSKYDWHALGALLSRPNHAPSFQHPGVPVNARKDDMALGESLIPGRHMFTLCKSYGLVPENSARGGWSV